MQVGESAQVLESSIRDLCVVETEGSQSRETAQMLETGIGDLSVVEQELSQIDKTAQVLQTAVTDPCVCEIERSFLVGLVAASARGFVNTHIVDSRRRPRYSTGNQYSCVQQSEMGYD